MTENDLHCPECKNKGYGIKLNLIDILFVLCIYAIAPLKIVSFGHIQDTID